MHRLFFILLLGVGGSGCTATDARADAESQPAEDDAFYRAWQDMPG